MIVVDESEAKAFSYITQRNLLWQYDFLTDSIRLGLPRRRKLDGYLIRALNFFAVVNLSELPGEIRRDDVHIEGSDYQPPAHHAVSSEFLDFIPQLHSIWDQWDSLHVAAYVLWKIGWIHP